MTKRQPTVEQMVAASGRRDRQQQTDALSDSCPLESSCAFEPLIVVDEVLREQQHDLTTIPPDLVIDKSMDLRYPDTLADVHIKAEKDFCRERSGKQCYTNIRPMAAIQTIFRDKHELHNANMTPSIG